MPTSATFSNITNLFISSTIPIGTNPWGIAINKAGTTLFYSGDDVRALNTQTNSYSVITTQAAGSFSRPISMCLSYDEKVLFVMDYDAGEDPF